MESEDYDVFVLWVHYEWLRKASNDSESVMRCWVVLWSEEGAFETPFCPVSLPLTISQRMRTTSAIHCEERIDRIRNIPCGDSTGISSSQNVVDVSACQLVAPHFSRVANFSLRTRWSGDTLAEADNRMTRPCCLWMRFCGRCDITDTPHGDKTKKKRVFSDIKYIPV